MKLLQTSVFLNNTIRVSPSHQALKFWTLSFEFAGDCFRWRSQFTRQPTLDPTGLFNEAEIWEGLRCHLCPMCLFLMQGYLFAKWLATCLLVQRKHFPGLAVETERQVSKPTESTFYSSNLRLVSSKKLSGPAALTFGRIFSSESELFSESNTCNFLALILHVGKAGRSYLS